MADRPGLVIWAQAATQDLTSIVGAIAETSPINARRVLAKLRERADQLHTLPDRGRRVPELVPFGILTFRQVVVRPWRIVYRIDSDRVVVVAVLDGRRDLEEILLERLIRST